MMRLFRTTAPLFRLLDRLKAGEKNILGLLKLSEKDFHQVPFEEILNSPHDAAYGVDTILERYNRPVLGIFDHLVLRYYDNGDQEFLFITHTHDVNLISKIVDKLHFMFGTGLYDDRHFHSFYNVNKVQKLARGIIEDGDLPISCLWFHHAHDLVFKLTYFQTPKKQLGFIVKKNARILDRTPRKNSVLDFLEFNIDDILSGQESLRHIEFEDNNILYIDFTYQLPVKEFGIFDIITIRIFDNSKIFNLTTQTHIFLSSSIDSIPIQAITDCVTKLTRIYGGDHIGSSSISINDIQDLEEGNYWLGRTWHLNYAHAQQDLYNPEEKEAYCVAINQHFNERIELSILSYNTLIELFGEEYH
ncbi:hypothetical protein JAO76_02950 [Pontibacter sp. BT310]|uniref:Uncharacterized protein n=1 Tax=Pontibacter populi TaxID=890055 RepID=A0ABS6X7L8_9BACT|nr:MULTISPECIES: hypothetical protein [Pontibacter]MBJ6117134.1 hypothetical protein [Pontibacter sp. BT310]MBR0569558.1 hypothetical protein [Microvirga sp. STS03]MBW3363987.1 hypothetical protein [Pontibacter populi]